MDSPEDRPSPSLPEHVAHNFLALMRDYQKQVDNRVRAFAQTITFGTTSKACRQNLQSFAEGIIREAENPWQEHLAYHRLLENFRLETNAGKTLAKALKKNIWELTESSASAGPLLKNAAQTLTFQHNETIQAQAPETLRPKLQALLLQTERNWDQTYIAELLEILDVVTQEAFSESLASYRETNAQGDFSLASFQNDFLGSPEVITAIWGEQIPALITDIQQQIESVTGPPSNEHHARIMAEALQGQGLSPFQGGEIFNRVAERLRPGKRFTNLSVFEDILEVLSQA